VGMSSLRAYWRATLRSAAWAIAIVTGEVFVLCLLLAVISGELVASLALASFYLFYVLGLGIPYLVAVGGAVLLTMSLSRVRPDRVRRSGAIAISMSVGLIPGAVAWYLGSFESAIWLALGSIPAFAFSGLVFHRAIETDRLSPR